jgi:hypothetical protein
LARTVQRAAITLAGVVGGALVAPAIVDLFGLEPIAPWLLAVIGALVGGALVLTVFEWALIVLSALVGGALIAEALPLERPLATVVLVLAAAAGIVMQLNLWRSERR